MFDFDVEIYDGMQLSHGNFADYIKNKMVLICPNVKTMQKPTLKYFQYLEKLLNLQNLDEIIIIDSTGSKFFHPTVHSFFPKITTVSTTSEKYIQAGIYLASKDKEKSKLLYEEVVFSKNKFYSILALNNIIENDLEEDSGKILNFFKIVENIKTDKEKRNLIKLKKALYLMKISKESEGKKLLKEIIKDNSIWNNTAIQISTQ